MLNSHEIETFRDCSCTGIHNDLTCISQILKYRRFSTPQVELDRTSIFGSDIEVWSNPVKEQVDIDVAVTTVVPISFSNMELRETPILVVNI